VRVELNEGVGDAKCVSDLRSEGVVASEGVTIHSDGAGKGGAGERVESRRGTGKVQHDLEHGGGGEQLRVVRGGREGVPSEASEELLEATLDDGAELTEVGPDGGHEVCVTREYGWQGRARGLVGERQKGE